MLSGTEKTTAHNSQLRELPTLARSPAPQAATHVNRRVEDFAAAHAFDSAPEQVAGIFRSAEFSNPANDSQKARALHSLQRSHGNHYVQRMMTSAAQSSAPKLSRQRTAGKAVTAQPLAAHPIQTKLEVSTPGDALEREAERMAHLVMSMPASGTRASSAAGNEPQRESQDTSLHPFISGSLSRAAIESTRTPSVTPEFERNLHVQRGGGRALSRSDRDFFESRFGHDFSGVRVHDDANAHRAAGEVNAQAFTHGRDIYFNRGKYQPGTSAGRHLLAHELVHTIQQTNSGGLSAREGVTVGRSDDLHEQQAEAIATRVAQRDTSISGDYSRQKITRTGDPGQLWVQRLSLGGVWSGITGAVSTVGGAVGSAAQAVGRGIVSAGHSVYSAGAAAVGAITAGIGSLAQLLGIPAPAEGSPAVLDLLLSVLRNPLVMALPGFVFPAALAATLAGMRSFLSTVWRVMQNPAPLIEGIKTSLGAMISNVPALARTLAQRAVTFSPPWLVHLRGIWRHLEPKLQYLASNWWQVIKDTAWDMLWPWPGVWEDLKKIWTHIKSGASNVWHLHFGAALDDLLAIAREANSAAGRLYGWFFIASVLVGAIAGAIVGEGVGALPGAAAGASFAAEVGEVLLITTVAAEGASLLKAGVDLVFTTQTPRENEEDYEQISNSSITLGITGAMVLLGAIAARIAKALIRRVAGLVWDRPALRGQGGPARGDIIEVRVLLSERVRAALRLRTVTWLEVIRRNFPVIDLLEGGNITVTPRPGRRPLYTVTGGRLISVKSTAQIGAAAMAEIRGWVDELAGFTTRQNVTVTSPSGRTLIVAQPRGMTPADIAALTTYANGQGVDLQLTTALPPTHPSVVFVDSIPSILQEAGVVAGEHATPPEDQGQHEEQ